MSTPPGDGAAANSFSIETAHPTLSLARQSQKFLASDLEALRTDLDINSREANQGTIRRLKDDARFVISLLDRCLDETLAVGQPSSRLVSAANSMFDILELLERIMLNLEVEDLLKAEQACFGFWLTIAGSLKLQRRAFLQPDASADFRAITH